MNDEKVVLVTLDDENKRIDVFLSALLEPLTRNHIKKMIDEKLVKVNDKVAKASYRLRIGDKITYTLLETAPLDIKKEDVKLDIIYEDKDLIVINKPINMTVHPHPGHYEGTLVNALLAHCTDLSGINGVERPGIVHRLDKLTSGLMVVAKNDYTHNFLAREFSERKVEKHYIALIVGNIKEDAGEIRFPLGRSKTHRLKMTVDKENGKEAITKFKVLRRYVGYTLVEVNLITGRTHQIRVHFAAINHPVVGDMLYGKGRQEIYKEGQLLHANFLGFTHPRTKKWVAFSCDLPAHFKEVLSKLDVY
jgi:23S rRNA pseudouridine1911/1915/1917 synthase